MLKTSGVEKDRWKTCPKDMACKACNGDREMIGIYWDTQHLKFEDNSAVLAFRLGDIQVLLADISAST